MSDKPKTDREIRQEREDYERGQKEGSESGVLGELGWIFNPFSSKSFDKGFVNGTKNRPK